MVTRPLILRFLALCFLPVWAAGAADTPPPTPQYRDHIAGRSGLWNPRSSNASRNEILPESRANDRNRRAPNRSPRRAESARSGVRVQPDDTNGNFPACAG